PGRATWELGVGNWEWTGCCDGQRNHWSESWNDPGVRAGRQRHARDRHQGGALRRASGEDRADRRLRVGPARARRGEAREGQQGDRRALQEGGQRAADARARRSDARQGWRRAEGGRPGARRRRVQGRRTRRRHRHQPRQGLPGGRQAPQLPRRRGDAWLDVPPRARLDRRVVVPVARRERHARRGPDGRRPRDGPQPEGRAGGRRQPPAARPGRGPRRAGHLYRGAQGRRREARAGAAGGEDRQGDGGEEAEEVAAASSRLPAGCCGNELEAGSRKREAVRTSWDAEMKLDVVNSNKETVGSLDLKDEVFGGRVNTDLIWEAVVHQNAAERRGTHATKNRANVSRSARKPPPPQA